MTIVIVISTGTVILIVIIAWRLNMYLRKWKKNLF